MKNLILIIIGLFGILGKVCATDNILFLSDIHFNPYGLCSNQPCQVLSNLIEKDIKDWPQILANDNAINYKIETSNSLLITGLNNLAPIIKQNNVKNIFLTGDILTHKFDDQYFKYAAKKYNNQNGLTQFSLKVFNYVLESIKSSTNNAKVFYVLGNNDGDHPDYITPSPEFLQSVAKILSKQLLSVDNAAFEQDFSTAGYFSLALNNKVLIIGINSNLLSTRHPNVQLAALQLQWLEKTLAKAKKDNQHVILLQHIPYGADFYKSTISKTKVMLMDSSIQQQYLDVIKLYGSSISGIYAGHFHADYFSLLPDSEVPVVATIAFNAIFGNNPGFKILNLDESGYLSNYTAYYTNLAQDKRLNWQIEYQLNSTYHGNIRYIIKTLALNSHNKSAYRLFYNGQSLGFPAPINFDANWNYYACALTNITAAQYQKCISKPFMLFNINYTTDFKITLFSIAKTLVQILIPLPALAIFDVSAKHLELR